MFEYIEDAIPVEPIKISGEIFVTTVRNIINGKSFDLTQCKCFLTYIDHTTGDIYKQVKSKK